MFMQDDYIINIYVSPRSCACTRAGGRPSLPCYPWLVTGGCPVYAVASAHGYGRDLGGFGRDLGKVLERFGDSCQQVKF